MKRYFCTLFDSNYLVKGLTMIKSLTEFCNDCNIFVLCMDNQTKFFLEKINIPQIKCIAIKEVEKKNLLSAKKTRTKTEYCWTLASYFTWYVLEKYKKIDFITYLDADIMFYSDLDPIFEEIGDSSIAIIEHRFSEPFKSLEVNGRFCVEWNSFRRDQEGMKCLKKWRNQCLEWCYYKLEYGKMGDQKYLDEWPNKYNNCHIIKHVGAGVAPWNYSQYNINHNHPKITINGEKLIFYHFHQFQILKNKRFFRLGDIYTSHKTEPNAIYIRYEKEILKSLNEIRNIDINFVSGISKNPNFLKEKIKPFIPRFVKNIINRFI